MIKVGEAFEKLCEKGSFDAGCHTNFSMKSMREKGGFDVMIKVGEAFEKVVAPILDEVDARERWL